jgi:hypothetical protein
MIQSKILGTSLPPLSVQPLKEDGFSKSSPHPIISQGYQLENQGSLCSDESPLVLKKREPARLINVVDPSVTYSTSRVLYQYTNPVHETLRLQKSGISIGKKEPSGSVRDFPSTLPRIEPAYFQSETTSR